MKRQSEIAEAFARKAHEGQFRRDGVTPYITHPERVVAILEQARIDGFNQQMMDLMFATAWLHDTMEDCPEVTRETMTAAGIDGWVVAHVESLTRSEDSDYEDYLQRIKGSRTERLVKTADIIDNLTDSPTPKQAAKYRKALLLLVG